jgi:uncharacterized protein YggE
MRSMMKSFCLAAALAAAPIAALAQPAAPAREPILSVRGEGTAEAKPDNARVTLRVVSSAPTLAAAMAAHQGRAADARRLLDAAAADGASIESSTFSAGEASQGPQPRGGEAPRVPRYDAVTIFTVTLGHLDRVDAVVARLAASGLFEVQGLAFGVADERAPMNEARRKAVADARAQAETYAEAAGLRLGDIVELTDGGGRPTPFRMAAAAPSAQIQPPETLSFTASVGISWSIAPRR